jgi:large subunit ribosomal protein L32e
VLFVLWMVINKELLQARKKISDRRPNFVRQESWRYDRLADSWRKPKGKDNKMRRQLSGSPRLVKIGYRGPRKARGLHPSGYRDNIVFNVNDLTRLDSSKDAARIAHVVGQRKRLLILAEARAKGVKVLNPGKEQKAEGTSETKETRKRGEEIEDTSMQESYEDANENEIRFKADEDAKQKANQLDDQKKQNNGEDNTEEKEIEGKLSEDKNENESGVTKS